MKNIPTAEEFFEQGGTYPELAIKFAKLHVEAALKKALDNAEIIPCGNPYDPSDNSTCIDENSILNSYPLENIK